MKKSSSANSGPMQGRNKATVERQGQEPAQKGLNQVISPHTGKQVPLWKLRS